MDGPGRERQEDLLAQAGRYLAGGGLGLFVLPPELNLVVARGEGARVWDVAGREYIDYHLSSGPALLGHAHPAVTAAIEARLSKGTTYYFLNEPEIELARRLVEAVPCGEVVHYTGSGTEATFYALRIARAHTGREKVLKFEGAWHGMHDYGLWGTVPRVASDYPRAR
jgi:glutamate-1-semialdehyde 2,1-aminomutase